MPSYEPPPYRRNKGPQPTWLHVIYHPPEKGKVYQVRQGQDGEEFTAFYSYSCGWFHVLSGTNGDGTRELGERLRDTSHLHYRVMM